MTNNEANSTEVNIAIVRENQIKLKKTLIN